ncbi:cyclin-dependent kinase-like 2 [Nilaparvata lugens]|uniref:cyclin-dependent kinase-like 2 n=1 Tax=Nilaparvata lugens TaxID=108931 RepID=UPI00193E2496|nr:cyclin-dependent kinase-like 2 [Nilaparvata lugens]XP_039299212.1 cyclin-dependent kinase-like 2 [Nilaparvata lugens]XP_039299220.1 cyclin-dependent kinase-like 2 [Nilaparvata lugens]XP_039299227.1 cyclin-dependent kinase-like 2 [Nilaparvata lugens]
MEKYEHIEVVGEGSYGIVMKCRHKETGQIVAIKKFIETEEDHNVRKMALREIRMLRRLHHDNLVNMIEVFRRKKRFFLVFEYMDHTVLDELETTPGGLGEKVSREHLFQVVRAIHFCHNNNIVHRDVKPENILVSTSGVVKLCDFGFARLLVPSGENYTEYVATRWYRAPELLVGDTKYGRPVDIWAIGCLLSEMISGDPLFPGDSDIDQIYKITNLLGKLCPHHQQLITKNPNLREFREENITEIDNKLKALVMKFPSWSSGAIDFLFACLRLDPNDRANSNQLLDHTFFTHDDFPLHFLPDLQAKIHQEFQSNILLRRYQMNPELEKVRGYRRTSQTDLPRWRISLVERQNNPISPLVAVNGSGSNQVDNGGQTPMEDETESAATTTIGDRFSVLNKYSPLQLTGASLPPRSRQSTAEGPSSPAHHFHSLGSELHNSLNANSSYAFPMQTPIKNVSFSNNFRNDFKRNMSRIGPGLAVIPRANLIQRVAMDSYCDSEFAVKRTMNANNRKNTYDDFSLPNLPGAKNQGKSNKKKLNPVNTQGTQFDAFISPRLFRSRSPSSSPKGPQSSNLPMV